MTLVNGVDKLQRLTRGAPVRRSPRPITTREQRSLQRVIRRLTWVIRCTRVRNEAQISAKPPLKET
jgi:hypothetical protein